MMIPILGKQTNHRLATNHEPTRVAKHERQRKAEHKLE